MATLPQWASFNILTRSGGLRISKKKKKKDVFLFLHSMIDRKEIIIVCLLRYGSWLAQNSTICREFFAGNVVGSSRVGGILVEKEEAEDWPAFLFSQKNRRGGGDFFLDLPPFFRRFCLPWQRKLCEKRERRKRGGSPANCSRDVAAKAEKKYFLPICLWENKGSGSDQ